MKHDPALLGLVIAKKKPAFGDPPPMHDSPPSSMSMGAPPPTKPKADVSIKIGKDGTDPDAATEGDEQGGKDPHQNLDEIMSGDPKVASAMTALLQALCDEEKAEGSYGEGGGEATGTDGIMEK